jgi:hypothetical protein
MSTKMRVIEYEIVTWADLLNLGSWAELVESKMGTVAAVGVLRCATRTTTKVTFIGDAEATRELIKSGKAGNPVGVSISKEKFPIMLSGWPHRLGME